MKGLFGFELTLLDQLFSYPDNLQTCRDMLRTITEIEPNQSTFGRVWNPLGLQD
jgi:hypothetical protein